MTEICRFYVFGYSILLYNTSLNIWKYSHWTSSLINPTEKQLLLRASVNSNYSNTTLDKFGNVETVWLKSENPIKLALILWQ